MKRPPYQLYSRMSERGGGSNNDRNVELSRTAESPRVGHVNYACDPAASGHEAAVHALFTVAVPPAAAFWRTDNSRRCSRRQRMGADAGDRLSVTVEHSKRRLVLSPSFPLAPFPSLRKHESWIAGLTLFHVCVSL